MDGQKGGNRQMNRKTTDKDNGPHRRKMIEEKGLAEEEKVWQRIEKGGAGPHELHN